mgnify:CR=1 FL=1
MRDRPNDHHRQQTEREIGRRLGPDEVVDHVDTDKANNAKGNRRVMSRGAHSKHHTDPGVRTLAKLKRALTIMVRREKAY